MNQFEVNLYTEQNVDKMMEAYARLTGQQTKCPPETMRRVLSCLYGDKKEKPLREPAGKIVQFAKYCEVAK